MMKTVSRSLFLFAFIVSAGTVNAIEPIPDETGWSGIVTLGVGSITTETNMVAGVDRFNLKLGDKTINSLSNDPNSKSSGIPQLNLNINYTFSGHTQLFVGNTLENLVQFDTVTVGGVRHQFADNSIVELAAISSPRLSPVQVWEDPYVVGVKRKETDRTSTGARIEYDKILGTGFGVKYTQRKIDIDDERSGTTQLGLPPDQAKLLQREGDTRRLDVMYRFPAVGRNVFDLTIAQLEDDLDGKAMSGDQTQAKLTWAYLGSRFTVVSNAIIGQQDYDKRNPVFNKTRNDDILGLGFYVIDKRIFNSKNWFGQASLVWYDQDANIDFYDSSSTFFAVGAQYRF